MFEQIKRYLDIPAKLKYFIAGSFLLGLNNAVYFLIANIYMSKSGFTDPEIASFITYRFALVMILAVPFGMYIKTKPLKPFYYFAAVFSALISLIIVYGIEQHYINLVRIGLTFFGFSFMLTSISSMPFILRNTAVEHHTETISANFSTWSLGQIFVGIMIFTLSNLFPEIFNEKRLLQLVALISLSSIYCIYKIGDEVHPVDTQISGFKYKQYDWDLIIKAVVPTFLIALGAGLSIPFINLFFFKVFQVDYDTFSIMASFCAVLVGIATFAVPMIKRALGYEAITITQSIGIVALFGLATTEFFSGTWFVVFIAGFLYTIRQPLMSLAGPLTSEMTMYYVGKNNQEIMAALNAAIWSGSWFFSSIIFGRLRAADYSFGNIFYITSFIYVIGVVGYWFLIKDYRRRKTF